MFSEILTLTRILTRRKESARRNLSFHLALAVPLAPHIRIVRDDESYISLQAIYENYCSRNNIHKDAPLEYIIQKSRTVSKTELNVIYCLFVIF
jgi:transformation/transcription domain-associated protein